MVGATHYLGALLGLGARVIRFVRKTGRRANGYEADAGPAWHAVEGAGWKALCGTEPGSRSDWSTYVGDVVTCPRCAGVLRRRGFGPDGIEVNPS